MTLVFIEPLANYFKNLFKKYVKHTHKNYLELGCINIETNVFDTKLYKLHKIKFKQELYLLVKCTIIINIGEQFIDW